jgi:hypothetical protein
MFLVGLHCQNKFSQIGRATLGIYNSQSPFRRIDQCNMLYFRDIGIFIAWESMTSGLMPWALP